MSCHFRMEESAWTASTLTLASARPSTAALSARLHPPSVTCTSRARPVSNMTANMEYASSRLTLLPTTSASVHKATQVPRTESVSNISSGNGADGAVGYTVLGRQLHPAFHTVSCWHS